MDHQVLFLINQTWTSSWSDVAMVAITNGGLIGCVLGALLLRARGRSVETPILVAQAIGLVAVLVFFVLAQRARPELVRTLVATPLLPGFPSGHVTVVTATVAVWWLAHGWNRRTLLLVVLSGLVAYSRVYLGHHYPTDVIAGMVLGASIGAGVYGVGAHRGDYARQLSWLMWPQVGLAVLVTMMAYMGLLPTSLLTWPGADKVLHLILFGLITLWLNLWLGDRRLGMGAFARAIPVAVALPFVVALSEEVMQAWSPLRTFDLLDLAADLIGMMLCWQVSLRLLRTERLV